MNKACCDLMAYYLNLETDRGEDAFANPDAVVLYDDIVDEYGIIIHDGGESTIQIGFCPWCGKKLPESKRERWFDELEAMGFDDPISQQIPKEYKTDAWWNKPLAQ